MEMKEYSTFPKVTALLEPHHQIFQCHTQDTSWWGGVLLFCKKHSVDSTAPADWAILVIRVNTNPNPHSLIIINNITLLFVLTGSFSLKSEWQRLICHKNPTNQPTNQLNDSRSQGILVLFLLILTLLLSRQSWFLHLFPIPFQTLGWPFQVLQLQLVSLPPFFSTLW